MVPTLFLRKSMEMYFFTMDEKMTSVEGQDDTTNEPVDVQPRSQLFEIRRQMEEVGSEEIEEEKKTDGEEEDELEEEEEELEDQAEEENVLEQGQGDKKKKVDIEEDVIVDQEEIQN